MRDAAAVALASAGFLTLLALAEAASRRWKMEPELPRKFAHVASGVLAAALPLFMSFGAVAVLALLFVPFMVFSRRVALFPAVHRVERSTLGEMYFPLGVLAVALAFPERVPYSYGVLVMGLSDAAASLVGQRYGRRVYRIFRTCKTYAGSGAFFATTLLLTVSALAAAGSASAGSLVAGIAIAVGLTVVEAAFGGGADNVVLPITAAALLAIVV
jgi:phytol kinase